MTSTSADKIAIVTDFLDKTGQLDIRGAGEHLHEDAVMNFPYLDAIPDVIGRTAIIEQIEATTPKMLEYMQFTYDAWYPTVDPDSLIVEYHSRCPLRDGSGVYENTYISVFQFIGDQISYYREYMNPLPTAIYEGKMGPAAQ